MKQVRGKTNYTRFCTAIFCRFKPIIYKQFVVSRVLKKER
ncbi:hypothetical protein X975_14871, partial [Stegodyphus mimosarum]